MTRGSTLKIQTESLLDLWYGDANTMSGRIDGADRIDAGGRRPSTGEGVDRLKMSVMQAAMLWQQQQLFSNLKQLELELELLRHDCERVQSRRRVQNT